MAQQVNSVLIAKGLAIIFVVISHYQPVDAPNYWSLLQKCFHKFQVPVFFFLSGYLLGNVNIRNYIGHIQKKALRILAPYLTIALCMLVVKYASSFFVHLAHPVIAQSYLSVFLYPLQSYMPLLWFLYTLFIIVAIYPFLADLLGGRELAFVASLVLLLPDFPEAFCLDKVFSNLPIFALGGLMSSKIDLDRKIGKGLCVMGLLGGATVFFFLFLWNPSPGNPMLEVLLKCRSLLLAFTGTLSVLTCAMLLNQYPHSLLERMFRIAGLYSMGIYLLHTFFESSARIFFYKVLNSHDIAFLLKALVAVSTGVIMPLLFEKFVLRRFFITRRMVLGLSK